MRKLAMLEHPVDDAHGAAILATVMSVGGEWFGMWMSKQWDGVPDAFRFFITIIAVLIYLVLPDGELES